MTARSHPTMLAILDFVATQRHQARQRRSARITAQATAAAVVERLEYADTDPDWLRALCLALIADQQPESRALYLFLVQGGHARVARAARRAARTLRRPWPATNGGQDADFALRAFARSAGEKHTQ